MKGKHNGSSSQESADSLLLAQLCSCLKFGPDDVEKIEEQARKYFKRAKAITALKRTPNEAILSAAVFLAARQAGQERKAKEVCKCIPSGAVKFREVLHINKMMVEEFILKENKPIRSEFGKTHPKKMLPRFMAALQFHRADIITALAVAHLMVPEDNPPAVGAETWDGKDTSSISGAIIFGIVNHKANASRQPTLEDIADGCSIGHTTISTLYSPIKDWSAWINSAEEMVKEGGSWFQEAQRAAESAVANEKEASDPVAQAAREARAKREAEKQAAEQGAEHTAQLSEEAKRQAEKKEAKRIKKQEEKAQRKAERAEAREQSRAEIDKKRDEKREKKERKKEKKKEKEREERAAQQAERERLQAAKLAEARLESEVLASKKAYDQGERARINAEAKAARNAEAIKRKAEKKAAKKAERERVKAEAKAARLATKEKEKAEAKAAKLAEKTRMEAEALTAAILAAGTARMEAATLERRVKRARSEANSLEKDAKKAKREAVAKIKAAKLKALAFNTKAVDAAVPSTRPSLPSAPPPTDYEIIRILASRPPYMLVVDLTAHFTGRLTTKQERKNFSNSMKRIGSFFFNQGNIKCIELNEEYKLE